MKTNGLEFSNFPDLEKKLQEMIIKKIIFLYFVLVALFLLSLFFVTLIPTSLIKDNIGASIKTIKSEGTYPSFGSPHRKIVLDNFTDSLMLNTALSAHSNDPIKSLITNERFNVSNGIDQIKSLEEGYRSSQTTKVGYERYWHGYLVYLRPLLVIFSYSQIRILLTLMLFLLFFAFIFLIKKNLGVKYVFLMFLSFLAVDAFYLGQSMQFFSVFFIGITASILLLMKKTLQPTQFFFVVGGLTVFFDLLTAPLITLFIPLVIYILLKKPTAKQIIQLCCIWSFGYLLLWSTKWILATLIYSPDAFSTAIDQIINRTVNQADVNYSHINAVKLNIFQLIGYDKLSKVLFLTLSLLLAIYAIVTKKISLKSLSKIRIWILLSILPYIWYLVVSNHSYLHVWYTYRIQFITVFSILMAIFELPSKSAVKNHH